MDFQFFSAFFQLLNSHQELVARVELLEEAILAEDDDEGDEDLGDEDLGDDTED